MPVSTERLCIYVCVIRENVAGTINSSNNIIMSQKLCCSVCQSSYNYVHVYFMLFKGLS